jgi:hypothetical protein
MAQYLRVNERCHEIAQKLDWTTARVAKVIWTACRYHAIKGKNLSDGTSSTETTHDVDNVKSNGKKDDIDDNNRKPRSKRKRRQT